LAFRVISWLPLDFISEDSVTTAKAERGEKLARQPEKENQSSLESAQQDVAPNGRSRNGEASSARIQEIKKRKGEEG
jgi:hypothetical protein